MALLRAWTNERHQTGTHSRSMDLVQSLLAFAQKASSSSLPYGWCAEHAAYLREPNQQVLRYLPED